MRLQRPGSKRLTKYELETYLNTCQLCQGRKWISVAIKPHDDWETYRFPCRCAFSQGFVPDQLLDVAMFRNRTPDAIGEPEAHVLIHPAYMGHYVKPVREIMTEYRLRCEAQAQAEAEGLPF